MKALINCEIINIDSKGIVVRHEGDDIFIDFKKCAINFSIKNNLSKSKCVAERNIINHTFVFYTEPNTTIKFKNTLQNLLKGKSANKKFIELQKAIDDSGYISFDLS